MIVIMIILNKLHRLSKKEIPFRHCINENSNINIPKLGSHRIPGCHGMYTCHRAIGLIFPLYINMLFGAIALMRRDKFQMDGGLRDIQYRYLKQNVNFENSSVYSKHLPFNRV